MKRPILIALILILSFLGLADSAYIAQNENAGTPLICNIQSLSGCNVVAQSAYSKLFSIPLADYGLAFFGVLFLLAAIEIVFTNQLARRLIQLASAVGLIASAYFTLIQITVIDAICIYCMASSLISLLVFVCAYFIEPLGRKRAIELPVPSAHSNLTLPPPAV